MKKALVLSDTHCGSHLGLIPPAYFRRADNEAVARSTWKWFEQAVKREAPYDYMLFGGDAIDGAAKRQQSTGLLTADLHEQVDIAAACFKAIDRYIKPKAPRMGVTGTGYHTDIEGTPSEHYLGSMLGWDAVDDMLDLDIAGARVILRHHTGNSSIPHGGHTAPAREAVWQRIHTGGMVCTLRGHVHRASYAGVQGQYLSMTLPSLQLAGTRFGRQKCDGWCHFGITVLHFDRGEIVDWSQPVRVVETAPRRI
jgi:hypothetical protein